jgi:predicted porin
MLKKTAFAFLALNSVLPAAFAQSSVTLYGIVDAGLGYTSGQRVSQSSGAAGKPVVYTNASNYGFASGTWSGDRWGFKGNEDLGGGLAAIFQLENGFNIGTGQLGQGGREFGRQAWMGLSSTKFGKVTLGRQYDPIVDFVGSLSAGNFLTGMGAHPGDLDNIDNPGPREQLDQVHEPIVLRSPTRCALWFRQSGRQHQEPEHVESWRSIR